MEPTQMIDQTLVAILNAPALCSALFSIGGVVGWWLRSKLAESKLNGIKGRMDAFEDRKVLIEERLAAVLRNEGMLRTQISTLQEQFQVVEDHVLRQGHVPALIAATGSSTSSIHNIVLTSEALTGSLSALRQGIGGANIWMNPPPAPARSAPTLDMPKITAEARGMTAK